MAETEILPRWGLPEVNFVETDPNKIKSEIITGYEEAANRVLAEGDPVRVFLLVIADKIIHLLNCINQAGQQNLLSYAIDEALDALGVVLNIERLKASSALTTLRFNLVQALGNDYTIPAGFEVTNGVVTFATNEELIIRSGEISGEVAASCTTAGEAGNNYLAGQITTIVKPMTFLESATNISTTSGGAEKEKNADYANRLRLAPNSFSVAGPKSAYEYHTYTVNPAIIHVAVNSPNAGEVKIYPLLEGGLMPSKELLDQISAYFATGEIVPMTDKIEVLAPTAHNYTINVDYYINKEDLTKSEIIRQQVLAAVEEYRVWQQAEVGRTITPDELIHKVKSAGAAYVDLTTLSPASLEKLQVNEVAQCAIDKVVVTYKGTGA